MDKSGLDWQLAANLSFGLISFFGGWMMKIIFSFMSKIQSDYKELSSQSQSDYKDLSKELTSLALSMPEKYVPKNDFDNLVKIVHSRFDKLEEKLDSFREVK